MTQTPSQDARDAARQWAGDRWPNQYDHAEREAAEEAFAAGFEAHLRSTSSDSDTEASGIVQAREALKAIRLQIAKGPNPTPLDTIAKIDLLASQALSALTEDET